MKNGINRVTLMGNVGEDPKVNQFKENGLVANFSLATNEYYSDKSGKETQKTVWHRIVVWHKQAEAIQKYLKKGDPIYIEGKIQNNAWDDKDGVKHYSSEVYCDNFVFLAPKTASE